MQKKAALRFAHYTAAPIGNIEKLLDVPGTFANLTRIEPHLFMEHVAAPIYDFCRLPRGFLYNTEYMMSGAVSTMRRAQIDALDRLVRFWLRLRGVPVSMLSFLYDQHPTTVYRDCIHVAELVNEKLQTEWIQPIAIGSAEYHAKRGQGAFEHFPNALYAIDATKCHKRRPYNLDHGLYYDGHKHEYNIGFLCGVDCDGLVRFVSGHYPGSCNDIEMYYDSDLYRQRNAYLGPNDKVLADGIFARVQGGNGPFIVPVCYMDRDLTLAESRFNKIQSWDRAINEHYFSRLKGLFPVFKLVLFLRETSQLCVHQLCHILQHHHPSSASFAQIIYCFQFCCFFHFCCGLSSFVHLPFAVIVVLFIRVVS